MKTEVRIEFGSAARRNLGKNSGQKIHRLVCTYIVGLDDGEQVKPGTYLASFVATGKPVLVSCYPACGCTMGQHAGKPFANLSAENVTCTKCGN